ncbi:methyl-accepting chemotaxis protein [Noviherbaspirillum suwonense]|uniref:Methyl-accepting chemotaxis sensory transducer with TarH sensor n=1 Tax=Noviherbaspirillum suwonense TaxID=1224511 RepID=A0ABY1QRS2_9BURK|nr:methyl-accepting chemotaxis protein [Noviherbaspirillum suwonense]SMP78357.1 methyl-accepting chemotaxis sensory transducer with TarH sensor [Noviherbaspirillum suwonense]
MLKNLTIKTRLIFVIGFLSLQLVAGGVIGIVSLKFANDDIESLYQDRLVATSQIDAVARLISRNEILLARAMTAESTKIGGLMTELEANRKEADALWKTYAAGRKTADEQKLAEQFTAARKMYLDEGLVPATQAVRGDDTGHAIELLHGPVTTLSVPMQNAIDKLIKLQSGIARADFERSQTVYQWVRNTCSAAVALGLLLALVIGYRLVRAITGPLDEAVRIASAVAAGDLTQHIAVNGNDETGKLMQALKKMNDSLKDIVSRVRVGTDTIVTASGQIASGNMDLSSRTEQQASSLEETASSMEQLNSTVRQNEDNARAANELALAASGVAVRGGQVVSEVVQTMGAINAASHRIADIIGVIDGIAFQTNILALNAAVEAARAGEHGRGFAVVATEVRSLAQKSASAAREIKSLITDSVSQVDGGTRLAQQAGETMKEVVASVRHVTEMMGQISSASAEQSDGIGQVNQAIVQMDQATQQNAALVEEAAAAAGALQAQAQQLLAAVQVFRLEAGAPAAPAPTATAAMPAIAANERLPAPVSGDDWQTF